MSNDLKPSAASFAKDAHTQTENDLDQRSSTSNLVEAQKRHRNTFFKSKRAKEPSEERRVSPNHRERKSDSRGSKRLPVAQRGERSTKPGAENPKKQSDESVCECRAQSSDKRREINKKCTARCKVETFGTIPFSQVVRPAIFDSVIYRRKLPPRGTKNEAGNVSTAASSKRTPLSSLKKLSDTSKNTAVHSSKKFKWKSPRVGNEVEREAREMRALKAYNEVTLLKDKKELEARKRPIAERQLAESSRTHSDRGKRNVPRNVDDYPDKENLFVDATTETEPLLNENSRTFVTTGGKYSCSSKLSKVSKIANKLLLDNFDRLRGAQARQSVKSKRIGDEVETKNQHTKYSRPKKLTKEEGESNDGSMVSMRKLEGTQKGRELERIHAKKDVRDPPEIPAVSFDVNSFCRILAVNERDKETSTSANLSVDFAAQAGSLLTVMKPTTTQDVASSWSSSTIDEEDEPYFPEQGGETIFRILELRTLTL